MYVFFQMKPRDELTACVIYHGLKIDRKIIYNF